MAGHSKFKNIMHRKGRQDAKRAKVFSKLIRELTVAARAGQPDPDANPRLRTAIAASKAANMPKDTMERAVKRGSSDTDGENFEEVRYEGYGPGGVAVIVEALTDNRNRTASEVRSAFVKHGGTLGETNSVAFQFNHVGAVHYPIAAAGEEAMFEAAIEAGADECESTEDGHELTCALDAFHTVRDALETKFGPAERAELTWKPTVAVEVDEEKAVTILKLIDVLDDNDDVQKVAANFEVADGILEQLSA